MKITIENTPKVVELVVNGAKVPARLWQGETADGIPVQCYVTLIAPEVPEGDPDIEQKTAQFSRDLERVATPRASILAVPMSLIL